MFALSSAVEVNPPDSTVTLSRSQVWQGLVMKAEYAVPFVPGMTECHILERFEGGFMRQIALRGEIIRERITLTPEVEVLFERVQPNDGSWITNVLSDSEKGLLLTFTFAVNFPGAAAGSEEEKRRGEGIKESYTSAVRSTIDEVRRRVQSGEINGSRKAVA